MEKHSAILSSVCRLGGQKCNETMKYNARMFANTLQSVFKSTASKTTLMFTPNIFVANVNDCTIVLNMVVSMLVVAVGPLYNGNRMPELIASYVKIRKRRAKGADRRKRRRD